MTAMLFKYRPLSGESIKWVERIFTHNEIMYSPPSKFNDPFDCRRVYEPSTTREELVLRKASVLVRQHSGSLRDAIAESDEAIPTGEREVEQGQHDQLERNSRILENSGILCLSMMAHDFVMWTHYAEEHSGICIRFNLRDVNNEEHVQFFADAHPIVYVNKMPVVSFVRDGPTEIIQKVFLTKSLPFSHEREFRIVRYDKGSGVRELPKGIIDAVILGCNITETNQELIIKACSQYDGDIDIVKADLDPDTFALKCEHLERV